MQLTDEQMEEAKKHLVQLSDLLEKLQCHSQAVEPCVKMVSGSICGKMKRDGMIRVQCITPRLTFTQKLIVE